MPPQTRPILTENRVETLKHEGKTPPEWRAWLRHEPRRWQRGRTENEAVARLFWFEGLLSGFEAALMIRGQLAHQQ